jgi:HlyD family secretion protein
MGDVPQKKIPMSLNKPSQAEKMLGVTLPPSPSFNRARLFGLLIIVCFFGAFLFWAFFADLESAAIAPGKIVISGNRRVIQHLEGGIVEKLYVREGSLVKKGQILLTLDSTKPTATLLVARSEVYELTATEARLLAEIYSKPSIEFPPILTKNRDLIKVQQVIKNQKVIFETNHKAFTGNVTVLKQRIEQLNEQIKGLRAQEVATKEQLFLIKSERQDVEALYKKRLVDRSRYLSLQREEASLEGQVGSLIAEIASSQQKIGETKIQIITMQDTRRKEALDELRETQRKLSEIQERYKAASDVASRTNIRSPQSGKVVGLNVHTIGGVIKPGEVLMEVVPKDDKLVVEAEVSPLDIDVVKPGLKAKINLSALNTSGLPPLLGEVTNVSADIFEDEKKGTSYYEARITIPAKELPKLGGEKLYPGMPAEVMIITDNRSPWQYFISPIQRRFNRAFREK